MRLPGQEQGRTSAFDGRDSDSQLQLRNNGCRNKPEGITPQQTTEARAPIFSNDWSSQDSVETLSVRLVSRFELLGTQPAEMTVAPRSIVEGIDVVGHVGDRQLSVLVDLFLDPLFLQAAEEGLGDGIVPAVVLSAHTRLEAIRATESAPRVAAVLSALVGVNQCAARSAAPHRHQDGIEHELAVNRGAGRPPRSCARTSP